MPFATVTLTSASTTSSTPVALNWIGGKPISVWVTSPTSTSSSVFNLQYTMDDLQRTSSGSVLWAGVSSAIGQPATTFNTTGAYPDGVFFQFLSPVAAVRLFSTAVSSGPLTMKVIQGEGWALLIGVLGGNMLHYMLGATAWTQILSA